MICMSDQSLLRRTGATRRVATGLAMCLGWLSWMAQAQTAAPGIALIDVLRGSLKQNPNTQLQQQQVIASQGAILQAQGQFDPQLSANITRQRDLRSLRADEIVNLEAAGIRGVDRQTTDVTTWRAGVEQILLNGVAVGGNERREVRVEIGAEARREFERTAGRPAIVHGFCGRQPRDQISRFLGWHTGIPPAGGGFTSGKNTPGTLGNHRHLPKTTLRAGGNSAKMRGN